jgi:septum formation protein
MPPQLILASSSRYRRDLLMRLRVRFIAMSPDVDETPVTHETPVALAQRLALAKANEIAQRYPDRCVIGSDQVAVCKGQRLSKPGDAAGCREQLQLLSGASAVFHTAVALVAGACSGVQPGAQQFLDTTSVFFRALSELEIERYIAAEQPFDCAGGFKCEGLGISLFSRVVSEDPSALIGLPLIGLSRALRQCGYAVP